MASPLMRKSPWSSATTERAAPVARLLAVTAAPARAAPLESVTAPKTSAVVTWLQPDEAAAAAKKHPTNNWAVRTDFMRSMLPPFNGLQTADPDVPEFHHQRLTGRDAPAGIDGQTELT